ncbi:hypothetical protein F5876DRAFT_70322 [Lentinula aff. lateritia]|uniref:Uncharacterized protein n=1 Tax=Lentinula aff. lateritia TaxID=2804960 RepID=A0ACC1TJC3_9AGAR|nr:hypothetical protein F5876DRAFT_70322 [Lentinula aff. lateritia]
MVRKNGRSAGATRWENGKHGIITPQEAASLTSDPTYIDATCNIFDNVPMQSFLIPRINGLPYLISEGPNTFISYTPMVISPWVTDELVVPEELSQNDEQPNQTSIHSERDQETFLENRKCRCENADLFNPEQAIGQASKSTERQNRLGLTQKVRKNHDAIANSKTLSSYFQIPLTKEQWIEKPACATEAHHLLNVINVEGIGAVDKNSILLERTGTEGDTNGVEGPCPVSINMDTEDLSLIPNIEPAAPPKPHFNLTLHIVISPHEPLKVGQKSVRPCFSSNESLLGAGSDHPSIISTQSLSAESENSETVSNTFEALCSNPEVHKMISLDIPCAKESSTDSKTQDSTNTESSDDDKDQEDKNGKSYENIFRELEKLIDQHKKQLQTKKAMLADSAAPSKIIELKALR